MLGDLGPKPSVLNTPRRTAGPCPYCAPGLDGLFGNL